MAVVKWSDHALERIKEQAQYIAEQSGSVETAHKWANDIFDESESLSDFPDIGHRLPEFPNAPYREILVRKNFRLIYRRSEDVCLVVTVRRCSMLLDESVIDALDAL